MEKLVPALRIGAATLGVVVLTGLAGVGVALADEPLGDDDVDVTVEIAEVGEPGVLALSVAGDSTVLTENGSTAIVREFTGQLPTVTVTDTRTAEEIPDGVGWYVLGTVTNFTGDSGQPSIAAENLGWAPHLIAGGDLGLVAEGDPVEPSLDGGPGLADQELLALAADSEAIAAEGSWSADALLTLKTAATVTPGQYRATLTLSLFE